uniref:Uncharacterized protein n=1 Tax=Oryza glumipatula TaxID=40148 RepID=A0A0E0A8W4_9ORYZ
MAKPTAEGAQQPCESWASTGACTTRSLVAHGGKVKATPMYMRRKETLEATTPVSTCRGAPPQDSDDGGSGALLAGVLNSGWNDGRANSSKKSMADTTSCLASPTRHVAAERAIPASMRPTEVERVLKQHRQPQSQETSTTTVLRWHHGRRQLKLQVDDLVNIFTRESGQLK